MEEEIEELKTQLKLLRFQQILYAKDDKMVREITRDIGFVKDQLAKLLYKEQRRKTR